MKPSKTSNRSASFGVTTPLGFRAAGGTCGIKPSGKPDLTLIVADTPCSAAGVFTVNRMSSAPVMLDKKHLRASGGVARAILCNSGNANASTGEQGDADALAMARHVAEAVGCATNQVLVSSTGIIGRLLPMDKINRGIATLAPRLERSSAADAAAARGIMTTDLVPKTAGATIPIDGKAVTIAGIAKGSGMIAPNMATMLAFVTTDAAISPAVLQRALSLAAAASFNRISVDQHTSPSDTLLVLASGAAKNKPIAARSGAFDAFTAALTGICKDLAYQVVKDGEGATRVFRVNVLGARSEREADRVGRCVVDSPLVKCAVHGSDPNWGRITTAAGYAGAHLKPGKMSLSITDGRAEPIVVFLAGQPVPLPISTQRRLARVMRGKEVTFNLDLGVGKASVQWLGCDLSREYIAINADYTT